MNRFLRTSSLAVVLLILAATVVAAQDELHQSYPLNANGTVSVNNISGFIRVTGWNENRVQVDAVKRGNQEDFAQVEMRVTASPERLQIETIYPRMNWGRNRNVWVEYELKVPRGALLNSISTTSGDITILDAGSRVTARATSGNINVRGASGDTNLNTTSGDITAERINGALTINATSGTVRVSEISSNLAARTTSGDITALDLRDDATLTTTSGDIRVEKAGGRVNARATSGTVAVKDVNGDATLESISDSVLAENIKGRVTVTAVSADITLRNVQEGARLSAVSGTINVTQTKGLIEARTTSGDVILRDVDSRELQLNTHSGSISYTGPIYDEGRYSFESFNGAVMLMIPANANFTLSATTFNGSVETDFPITIPPGATQTSRPKRLQGTHGNGGAQLKINGFNADIKIKKK
ncbi:MAG TPA: DUF4097 family beta strand repeat-containing protein [Blastocatellia bacterium]|nr:DUF4097 family beta strand repeat-containing protein [Blastocatellia bacterium]